MEHVNVKVFARTSGPVKFADAIPVFHRWVQDGARPELLIDVADYSHVPAGPGVVLIAHEANYGLDNRRNEPGLLYNRKAPGGGRAQENLRQAYESAVEAARRLEQEPEFRGKLAFDPGDVEVTANDRLLTPSTDEAWESIRAEVSAFFDGEFGPGNYTLAREGEPRERLRFRVRRT